MRVSGAASQQLQVTAPCGSAILSEGLLGTPDKNVGEGERLDGNVRGHGSLVFKTDDIINLSIFFFPANASYHT